MRHELTVLTLASLTLVAVAWAGELSGGVGDVWGPRYQSSPEPRAGAPPERLVGPRDRVRHWNTIAIDASGLDHTPVAPGENRVFGEQFGPTRASRAMAIVHIAIFDAVNTIAGGHRSYTGLARAAAGTSMNAAIAEAAHDTLAALFPSQTPGFDASLAAELARIPNGAAKADGIDLGHRAAAAILGLRADEAPRTPSRALASISSPAISRGSGARTRSASSPSPWAPTGAR